MYERLNRVAEGALAYRITAPLTRQEMRKMTTEIEGTIGAVGKVRLLIDLEAFPYADLGAFWKDLKFDVRYAGSLQKLALVGGGEIAAWSVRVFGLLTGTECRCFGPEETDEAWDWLVAG